MSLVVHFFWNTVYIYIYIYIGMLLLQMPGAAPPSEVMLHFFRCKGAMLVGEAITSLQAPGFLHSRDKRALFSSRLIVS